MHHEYAPHLLLHHHLRSLFCHERTIESHLCQGIHGSLYLQPYRSPHEAGHHDHHQLHERKGQFR